MTSLEKFLKGEPLNEEMERLMRGEEEDAEQDQDEEEDGSRSETKAAITDDDREHIRRLTFDPGWQVLLKLLDSEIDHQEDVARRVSNQNPFDPSLNVVWANVAYQRKSRERIVEIAKREIDKLARKKRKCPTPGPK